MADGNAGGDKDPLIIFTPSGIRGRVPAGTPVLTAARQLGVDLDSVCGGRGICSRCQVTPGYGDFAKHGIHVGEDALSEWNAVEERYKSIRGMIEGRRLGCQAKVMHDVLIDVPPESQVHKQLVRKRVEAREIVMDPATRLYYVEVEEPDMENPKGDLERLLDALWEQWELANVIGDLRTLQMLQPALREGEWKVTCAVYVGRGQAEGRIVQVWPGFHEGHVYGVSVDVGSTTMSCHMSDLVTGEVVASAGIMNPQIRFGEDLMSRVSYSMMNPGGAKDMTRAVREALNALIGQVAAEARVDRTDIVEAVLVGNPVMHHLFLGIDPVELGWAPFALATADSLTLWATEIDLEMHPDARIYVLPCIAGHVGADAAAVVLSEAPHRQDEMMLVVDVGTNAEIVLGNRHRMLACSSPTGPAFEGAQISSGQRAAPGAIERVRIDPVTKEPRFRIIGSDIWSDDPAFQTNGGQAVTGICGSGIIEVIAEMRMAGVINEDGVILSRDVVGSERLVQDGRTWSYILYDARVEGGPLIAVTQADIRAIQLGKAALYAGSRLLMDRMGVETVDRVVLAGAFGAHISPLHAMVLGMIPDCPLDKVSSAGNAAGTGARIALLNSAARREIEHVVRSIEKIETAVEAKFQQHFVDAIAIPHKTAEYRNLSEHVTFPELPVLETTSEGDTSTRRRRRRRA